MLQKFNFSYDLENDDLLLTRPNSKSKGSVELGNFVFDFDSKLQLVGIQVLEASKILTGIIGNGGISKKLLKDLTSVKIEIKPNKNLLLIKLYLTAQQKEMLASLQVPNLKETSPALAYA
jgi:hypothetical protein